MSCRTAGEPKSFYTVEFLTGSNGFFAPENGAAVGVSDGRYYADDGIEIINFGPGSGAQGHAANESVPIGQMVEAATIQLDVVRRLVGTAREPRVPGGEVK